MSADQFIDDISGKLSGDLGSRVATFIVNLAKDLSHFYWVIIFFSGLMGLLLFIWMLSDIKKKNAENGSGSQRTTGGIAAKFLGSVILAQIVAFTNAASHSVLGQNAMTPFSYLEKVQGSESSQWNDMLLGTMAIVTLISGFYICKGVYLFATLDNSNDREGQLYSAAYTILGAVVILNILPLVKGVAASGGFEIESLGGF